MADKILEYLGGIETGVDDAHVDYWHLILEYLGGIETSHTP